MESLTLDLLSSIGIDGFYTALDFLRGGVVALVWMVWNRIFNLIFASVKLLLTKIHLIGETQ